MSDFLRITTPLVNKNQNVQPTVAPDATGAFSLQSTTRVIQPHNQSELLKQNNGLRQEGDAPTLLLNLLKDPGVTVSYLKNVFMLEELYKLLPANNKTVTKEIESIFDMLLIKPEGLPQEMKDQENASTAFKGELFDLLREVSQNNHMKPETQVSIAQFLRAFYSSGNKQDILDSVANNLRFLREELSASRVLSEKLDALISEYSSKNAQENFPELKMQTIELIKAVEDSILFSPKLAKILSILTYNLSRYNTNTDYVMEAAFRLRHYLTNQERIKFGELFEPCMAEMLENGGIHGDSSENSNSMVISLLAELISRQIESSKTSVSESAKLESILHSLLSSPCNFTPLLHYILPLQYNDMKAFAEVWINPESDEKDMPEEAEGGGMHILMVIDVENTGRFEAEFYVYKSTIDFQLLCPTGCEKVYAEMMKDIPKLFLGTEYNLGKTRVAVLEKTRSLMDVFKSLPYRRVGVDVKI